VEERPLGDYPRFNYHHTDLDPYHSFCNSVAASAFWARNCASLAGSNHPPCHFEDNFAKIRHIVAALISRSPLFPKGRGFGEAVRRRHNLAASPILSQYPCREFSS
jgi:hypothetical protein